MKSHPFTAFTAVNFKLQCSEYLGLTKPRISLLCILMFCGGFYYSLFLSKVPSTWTELFSLKLVLGIVGTWASVASANVLNMFWERHSDKLMERTADRPLPSGRMAPSHALIFGLILCVISAVTLSYVNATTLILGMFALGGYVLIYTPLKRVTPQALIVGAVPGAMPPLMGWTAHYGGLHAIGLVLFGILLVWQVPHFIAIAVNHKEDYRKAGIKVLPLVAGEKRAVIEALIYSVLLLFTSLLLVPLARAGLAYLVTSSLLGLWMIVLCAAGLKSASKIWARRVFIASLVYLPVLTFVLVAEVLVKTMMSVGWHGAVQIFQTSAMVSGFLYGI